jgi:hypothetical protein
MKSALRMMADREAVHVIGDYLRSQNQFTTDVVSSVDDLSALRDKNRYDLIFIDLDEEEYVIDTSVAAAYDEDGKVTDVVIAAGDDTYEVAEGDWKMELMQLIDLEITIVGSVTEEEGIKTIEIEEYTVDK